MPLEAKLIAIDTSEAALAKNENADEKIVGDIQTCLFPPDSFDAVICWWVLEHIERPRDALANMATALREGGLLIIAVPYFWGFKAIATKLTPYRFHVWLARRSNPLAGTSGRAPYPTYLRRDIAPGRLCRLAAEHRLQPVYSDKERGDPEAILPRPLRLVWRAVGRAIETVTLGRFDPLLSDYMNRLPQGVSEGTSVWMIRRHYGRSRRRA